MKKKEEEKKVNLPKKPNFIGVEVEKTMFRKESTHILRKRH